MITEYVRYRLTGDADEFERAYARAQDGLRASPHCLMWQLSRCHEEPDRYVLRIEWDSLDGHVSGFRKSAEFREFLGHVRPYIEQLEEMQHYRSTLVSSRSICEAMGGPEAFFRIAAEMHEGMQADERIGRRFAKVAPTHVPHLAMWLTEVFGGPRLYSAVYDDIGLMLERHRGHAFREEERARFAEIAKAAVAEHTPEGEERAAQAIGRYFDWATGVAVTNSQPGHVADPSAGVPIWDWDATA